MNQIDLAVRSYESAQFLVQHCRSLSECFDENWQAYVDSEPVELRWEHTLSRPPTSKYWIESRDLPPSLRALNNDFLKNARDALDQVTHASNLALGANPRRTKTHFPMAQCPKDFDENAVQKGPCQHIRHELRPILRSYEPWYPSPKWDGGDLDLRVLGRLSGGHKHTAALCVSANLPALQFGNDTVFDVYSKPGGEATGGRGAIIYDGPTKDFPKKDLHLFFGLNLDGVGLDQPNANGYLQRLVKKLEFIVPDAWSRARALN